MKNLQFFENLNALLDKQSLLYNNKIALPFELRKTLPHVKEGLNIAQREIMISLRDDGSCNISEMSRRLSWSSQYTGSLVLPLIEKGFIASYKSNANKAAVFLQLTNKGLKLLEDNRRMWRKHIKTKVDKLSDEERKALLDNIVYINNIMRKI